MVLSKFACRTFHSSEDRTTNIQSRATPTSMTMPFMFTVNKSNYIDNRSSGRLCLLSEFELLPINLSTILLWSLLSLNVKHMIILSVACTRVSNESQRSFIHLNFSILRVSKLHTHLQYASYRHSSAHIHPFSPSSVRCLTTGSTTFSPSHQP